MCAACRSKIAANRSGRRSEPSMIAASSSSGWCIGSSFAGVRDTPYPHSGRNGFTRDARHEFCRWVDVGWGREPLRRARPGQGYVRACSEGLFPVSLSGLLQAVLPDPALTKITEAVGVANLELEGPTAVRPLVTAALAARRPVLAITATGHEADDLTAALRDLLGRGHRRHLPLLGDAAARAPLPARGHRRPPPRGAVPARRRPPTTGRGRHRAQPHPAHGPRPRQARAGAPHRR